MNDQLKLIVLVLVGWHFSLLTTPGLRADDKIDFAKQVQPIFQQHCYECHAGTEREGGLRLTNARDAMAENDSGMVAIVHGQPEESELVRRIISDDDSEKMPPERDGLSKSEIEIIKQWISEGATWPEGNETKHWAYVAPKRPTLPQVENQDWPRNAIDYFILAKLESSGFTPATTEDPARLLRRVSLALTGLPPSVDDVEAFVANPTNEAYEAFVDQCLQSPQYGERWAQPWLDLARYADSNGYQADQLRESWAYRDWVIKAMNSDMPFDQFTVEQLAGDLLPDATVDQKIATGFHRTVTCNVEAGVHPEQNRVNQVFDRVNTTGTVFLGTTLECAQCHNHKYDPFTQDEYYQLFAFFNNTPLEVELNSGVSYDFYGPKMDLPVNEKERVELNRLNAQLDKLNNQLKKLNRSDKKRVADLKANLIEASKTDVEWTTLDVDHFESTGGETHEILDDQSVLIGGSIPGTTVYKVELNSKLAEITAVKIEALTHPSIPGTGPGRGDALRTNFILSEVNVSAKTRSSKFEPVGLTNPQADYSQKNWSVANSIDGNPKTGWAIGQEFKKPHWASYQLEKPVVREGQTATLRFVLDQNYGRGRTIGRVRISATGADPMALNIPDNIRKILLLTKPNKKQTTELNTFLDSQNPQKLKLTKQIGALKKQIATIKPPTTLVMVEMEKPRETRKMIRGEYLNPGKALSPGVPEMLHPMQENQTQDRLGLARWITAKDNPLFARVTVNRWWSGLFGKGIVKSEEDFGTQSDPPTHPVLLDWLATELMERGWSRKQIHKQIVMSSTFRQSSRFTTKHLSEDPKNELYARGPRFRMPAEMIRDNGLAISGLLSDKMGGPPVMPFQPDRIWRAVGRNAPKWVAAKDENRFRRGVYVVWRRAAPYPSFVNFDAPDRAACVVKRPSTNTPLQALTLMNDKAYLEMAFALAALVDEECDGSVENKIGLAMKRCIARSPSHEELKPLVDLYEFELNRFSRGDKEAEQFLASINSAEKAKYSNEMAALTVVMNVLLNLDETINY